MTDDIDPEEVGLYSPHAEEALLGAALANPGIIGDLAISANDFYIHRHRIVYQTMAQLTQRNVFPDFVTLGTELSKIGQLTEVGGQGYLAGLIANTPSTVGAEDYARIVKEFAQRRWIMAEANKLAQAAAKKDNDLSKEVATIITSLANGITPEMGAEHWSAHISQADAFIQERAANPGKFWGLETGYTDYDIATGGMQKSEILLLSGEPGVGKSFFLLQMAQYLAESNHPGVIYSLEMQGKAVGVRALSLRSGVRTKTMKQGITSAEDWDKYYPALESIYALPVYMSDQTEWTIATIRADMARLKRVFGIEWFMVDYSYLLKDGDKEGWNEIQKTQFVINGFKNIAKSLDLAGLVIHSMNKAGQSGDNQIRQTSLRGSGQVSYDADVILMLTMPDEMRPSIIRATFGKGRELENPRLYFELQRMNNGRYEAVKGNKVNLNGK